MPTNYSGRVTLILIVVLAALWAIFPSGNPLQPDLKPGIDMVGGTKLLYEIKVPPGGYSGQRTLAEDVMDALKKRVDPSGVRNLIWRPQGNRLEIQMPLSKDSAQSKTRREEFAVAQRAFDQTNVRANDVLTAVEDMAGEARQKRLDELAMGSAVRKDLFDKLAVTFDQIKAVKGKDAAKEAELGIKYDEMRERVSETNLPAPLLTEALDLKGAERTKKLEAIRARFTGFDRRIKAIDDFVEKYDAYSKVRTAIDDSGELKRLLRGSGVLEFHILAMPSSMHREPTITDDEYAAQKARLEKDGPQVRAGDKTRWLMVDKTREKEILSVEHNGKLYALVHITPDKAMAHGPDWPQWGLQAAYPVFQDAKQLVGFTFDAQGAELFSRLTGSNVGRALGIVLDDKLISAPNINQQILGTGTIEGGGASGFDDAEQRYLISVLGAGSLPAQLTEEPISEQTVGPQLGADNLRKGLMSCVVGLIVVAIFLIGYYYLSGVVAFIAVVINLILILGVMAMFNATFTLPGVAGIVLSIGAAVDANVLIFERLREEQHRGLSLRMALRNSYDRAWSAILDSNMTTLITSFFLYVFGTEEVKGFGITLLIGLLSSLFTSLFVTKTIFGILIDKFGLQSLGSFPLTFKWWDNLLRPKIDWMGKVWWFIGTSTVLTIVGLWAFVHYSYAGKMMDIEFASGTSVQFDLKEPMPIDQVRKTLEIGDEKLPSPSVVSVGVGDREYEIVTPNANGTEVKAAILRLFEGKLKLQAPSDYQLVGRPFEEAMDKVIIPLQRENLDKLRATAGFIPEQWTSFRGGAAIVLKNVSPILSPAEIKDRIDRQRLQPQVGESRQQFSDYAVESASGDEVASGTTVVLVGDENVPLDEDQARWKEEVAAPMWKLLADAINAPPQLSKATTFNPQVAGDTQRNALLTLAISILVIMAYIWIRFGNLVYGGATVVAMIHDTLLVVGAVGLSHLLANTFIGQALLLEPFRMNLTVVAAILTVMSYSMIDTIVVFDRIRENRGKFGHLDRGIINTSINETLSRTLLTASTNLVTVFFMYIFGGAGIHGFTFVLLFGIIVGTYSSIAIAAPILLLSRQPQTGKQTAGKKVVPGQVQQIGV